MRSPLNAAMRLWWRFKRAIRELAFTGNPDTVDAIEQATGATPDEQAAARRREWVREQARKAIEDSEPG